MVLYCIFCVYLGIRGSQAFESKAAKRVWIFFVVLMSILFFAANLFSRAFPREIVVWMRVFGSGWLILVFYSIILIFALDVLRLCHYFWNIFPEKITRNYQCVKRIIFIVSSLVLAGVFFYGYRNFMDIKVRNLDITVKKGVGEYDELRLVVISDLHLGYVITRTDLARFVTKINEQDPDIVFIVGDLIDREVFPLFEENMQEEFRKIKAPLGVYVVLGNHEYFGGNMEENERFFRESNIRLLKDESIRIQNAFYLVGREDYQNRNRKDLKDLLDETKDDLPIILLDHQPRDLNAVSENKVALQFSGHTHDGQVFPANFIVAGMYEVAYGLLRKESSQIYVTSGIGLWGPPLRIGTDSELVSVRLHFKN